MPGLRTGTSACNWKPSGTLRAAVFLFAMIAALTGVWGGPALGDHEALVAQVARNMRVTGDWVVPQFLETKFVRKSPAPYWMVAGASYLFPNDPVTGFPVTPTAARVPSALCSFLTILLLWRLASSMFGARVGIVTAVVASSSIALLLYGPNATAEMPLAFGCTWAYFHFWFAMIARTGWRRFGQMMLFYVALGFAMLAKGPAPVALVGFPLAFWWFTQRPARILSRRGFANWPMALASFVRDLWPRFRDTFTQLWFIPGMILFASTFVPWMLAVGERHPNAWDVWNWQYVQRAEGDFPDTRHRGLFYYPPILAGLVLPWTIFIVEAAISPWVRRHARLQRGLYYAGVWMLMGTFAMAMMEFKKPYYILAAVPGLILLVGVAAEQFYRRITQSAALWTDFAGISIALVGLVVAAGMSMYGDGETIPPGLGPVGIAILAAFAIAAYLYRADKKWASFAVTALVTVTAFHTVWHVHGHAIDNIDKVAELAKELDKIGVPKDATVLWADRRPDARLGFYFNRKADHMLDPNDIVKKVPDREKVGKTALEIIAATHGKELLQGSKPVYLIVRRRSYDRWKDHLPDGCEIVGSVADAPTPNERDWLLLSNVNNLKSEKHAGI